MDYPRVLVLDDYAFTRSIHVMMLRRLGVTDIFQASDTRQALRELQASGGVDIVLCDLVGRDLDHLEFLQQAARAGLVRAVALCSTLEPAVSRALERTALLVGLELLGVMSQPMRMRPLHRMIQQYRQRRGESKVQPEILKQATCANDIRRGLAQGEFQAWFQPKLALREGTLTGVEALVRWEHPTRGLLLPRDFLTEVLANNLIHQMFEQVLVQGLTFLRDMRRQNINIEIAFNLHASQMASDDFADYIQGALKRYELPGSLLIFEVAESGLLDLEPKVRDNLLRLRMLGCGLAIDDFGLGFSSLQLLCRLPFSQIKLDKKFVNTLHHPISKTMVVSTLALAQSLNMSLVIEGIGSEWVRESLVQMGCKEGQGFFLGRPMCAKELQHWLRERNP
jgi:EAL domain-containing protein (putative c-di-GMP-specific phosphodiesterase class I)